ncbi:MAG: hypothetical protein HP495_10465 [Nitrospira sp.]|nr:hypothetical protein [Nitrospira sp.]
MGKTGLVCHPAFLEHDMGPGHPESPNRLRAIMQRLEESGTVAQLTRIEPRRAEDEWVTQVHSPSYVASLNRHAPTEGRVSLDPDTSMSPGSLHAAYLAAGGALAAVDAIMAHQVEHAVLGGTRTRPATVRLLAEEPMLPERSVPIRFRKHVPTAWLEITIHEGMNRQVRRMTAAVGHPTLRLVRIAIGAVRLGDLKPGEWRDLQEDDIPPLRSRPAASRRDG